MVKVNKKLSRLESLYQVNEKADPIHISDFIHHVFENQEAFQLEGEAVSKEWFHKTPKAFNFVDSMLRQNGHAVDKQSILEGIDLFREVTLLE
jgi:hypothetical protein